VPFRLAREPMQGDAVGCRWAAASCGLNHKRPAGLPGGTVTVTNRGVQAPPG